MDNSYNELFILLSKSIESFIQEVKNKKSTLKATSEWSVKDELCHIVFWHENYAVNYNAQVEHKDPPLPEGMSTINTAGVLLLQKYSTDDLIKRLLKANKSLYESIVVNKIPQMTYSKGGRKYKTADFLEMITRHVVSHTKQVKRAE